MVDTTTGAILERRLQHENDDAPALYAPALHGVRAIGLRRRAALRGQGLRLALTKKIIEFQGGHIGVNISITEGKQADAEQHAAEARS
jgi:hypothetical protein